jgi:uncharacterized protein YdhG (YjbR/CyaY superfamily)
VRILLERQPFKPMPTKKSKAGQSEAAAARAYIASLRADARAGLKNLQRAIATAAPGATLGLSYRIPAFRLEGRPLVWFAAFKDHCSFFPGAAAIRIHAASLKNYKISKGTIQFAADKPPSAALVAKLVKTRMAELRKTGP